ncbi:MAG: glycosyltransferase family 39 protein [Dehalococcoidia bacterium]|nr:glycosyltransferase family 39 protein [Dehalococcoidia bacterium]
MSRQQSVRQAALAGIVLLGFGLRVAGLGQQALWVDEASTVLGARNSLLALIPYSLTDTFPPLHFMLLHLLMAVAGESEFATRFLSAAAGLLVVPGVYLAVRAIAGPGWGAVGALFAAVSPYQVYFAQEVRGYALLAGLMALSLALWLRLTAAPTRRDLIAYWVVTAGAVYTQYLAVGPVAVLWAVWMLLTWRDAPRRRIALLGVGGVAVLFAPWALLAVGAALQPDVGSPTAGIGNSPIAHLAMIWRAGALEVGRLPLDAALRTTLVALPLGETIPVEPWLPAAVAVWVLALLGALPFGRGWPARGAGLALLLCVALPIGASLLTSLPTNRPHWPKYFIASSPALLALLALGVRAVWAALPNRAAPLAAAGLVTALVLSAAPALANNLSDPRYFRSDFRPEMRRLARLSPPGTALVANGPTAFADFWYYYRGGLRYLAPADPALADQLASAPAVWLVKNEPVDFDPDGRIERWLAEHAYRTADWYPANMRFSLYAREGTLVAAGESGARLGGSVELGGWAVRQATLGRQAALLVDLEWRAVGNVPPGLTTYLAVLDAAGRPWAQRDLPAGGGFRPSERWQGGETVRDRLGLLLPAGMPSGRYRVVVGLYGQRGARLPASTGGDRILLGEFALDLPAATAAEWEGGGAPVALADGGALLGAALAPAGDQPGARRLLTLDWVATGHPVEVALVWDGAEERESIALPAAPAGTLRRTLLWTRQPAAPGTWRALVGPAGGPSLVAGTATVAPRQPSPPPPVDRPLDLALGDGIRLAGLRLTAGACSAASPLEIALVWRAEQRPAGHWTSFVHLVDETGAIVAQRDQVPRGGAAPTGGWIAGEWLDDPQGRFALPPGRYTVVVGLYDADGGQRLVAPDGQDQHSVAAVTLGAP